MESRDKPSPFNRGEQGDRNNRGGRGDRSDRPDRKNNRSGRDKETPRERAPRPIIDQNAIPSLRELDAQIDAEFKAALAEFNEQEFLNFFTIDFMIFYHF